MDATPRSQLTQQEPHSRAANNQKQVEQHRKQKTAICSPRMLLEYVVFRGYIFRSGNESAAGNSI